MPSFSGNRTPIITATVCESNGRTNQFREINVIKRRQLNGDIVPADFLYVTAGQARRPLSGSVRVSLTHYRRLECAGASFFWVPLIFSASKPAWSTMRA